MPLVQAFYVVKVDHHSVRSIFPSPTRLPRSSEIRVRIVKRGAARMELRSPQLPGSDSCTFKAVRQPPLTLFHTTTTQILLQLNSSTLHCY
jgi:hypothetical protein